MRFVLDPVSLMLDVPALYVWPIACARMCVYVAACMRGPLSVAVCMCVCVCVCVCARQVVLCVNGTLCGSVRQPVLHRVRVAEGGGER